MLIVCRAKTLQNQLLEDLEHFHYNGVSLLRELAKSRKQKSVLMPVVFTSMLHEDGSSWESLGEYVYGN
jgi:non-ribosomal peptide synthetase component F